MSAVKMQVLFAKQTGHVLGAFTRTADPESKPKVSDLTGSGLLVRNKSLISTGGVGTGGEVLVVPPETLDVSVVDLDPAVLSSPREFVTGGGEVGKLGNTLIRLDPASPPPTAPTPGPSAPPTIKFSTTRVTIELDSDVTEEKGICVILQEAQPTPGAAPERRFAQGVVEAGKHFVSLDWKTSPDGSVASISDQTRSFFVLALFAGHQPFFGRSQPAP